MDIRRTKIIATLGPASDSADTIDAMVDAGMDVARFNFSHLGGVDDDALAALAVRVHAASRPGRRVGILADLPGPKLRVKLSGPRSLEAGEEVRLVDVVDAEAIAAGAIGVPSGAYAALRDGHSVLLADGAIEGEAVARRDGSLTLEVSRAGKVAPRQGLHLPDTPTVGGVLGDADEAALVRALALGVDAVAVSLVSQASDVEAVRSRVGPGVWIIAKIERARALDDYDAILAVSDGIMVARGDLGVEVPAEQLPGVQKELVDAAVGAGKMAIVATEMLESMKDRSRPTRAEVSDVANAALDGATAVMLSAESAVGDNPVAAVAAMDRILVGVESHRRYAHHLEYSRDRHPAGRGGSWAGALAEAATTIAELVGASAVVAVTETGLTASRLAAARPGCPIVGVCHSQAVAARMAYLWGVETVEIARCASGTELRAAAINAAEAHLRDRGAASDGPVVLLSGPPDRAGAVDTLRVVTPGAPR